ncbi:hypothetical protein RFI_18708 [Reticulomyxa filosa]|uniref:BHLH domain-containing protein n=1 Tax=Reticulomyxa filosa TaxID=46433 RepID=X6MX18_RETFI|nr:hypothetical protein RFI_18708 [Reticulomyxa filosa]|eukprot:ETO18558.1 hypothetical protein RFI_18708 [Reticulomyxa filosa]
MRNKNMCNDKQNASLPNDITMQLKHTIYVFRFKKINSFCCSGCGKVAEEVGNITESAQNTYCETDDNNGCGIVSRKRRRSPDKLAVDQTHTFEITPTFSQNEFQFNFTPPVQRPRHVNSTSAYCSCCSCYSDCIPFRTESSLTSNIYPCNTLASLDSSLPCAERTTCDLAPGATVLPDDTEPHLMPKIEPLISPSLTSGTDMTTPFNDWLDKKQCNPNKDAVLTNCVGSLPDHESSFETENSKTHNCKSSTKKVAKKQSKRSEVKNQELNCNAQDNTVKEYQRPDIPKKERERFRRAELKELYIELSDLLHLIPKRNGSQLPERAHIIEAACNEIRTLEKKLFQKQNTIA